MRPRLAIRGLALALSLAGCAGCNGCNAPGSEPEEQARVLSIAALDASTGIGASVSVGGVVVAEEDRVLVLQDASGVIEVHLPSEAPPLYGERLLVQGTLRQQGDDLHIDAYEWLYDSTRTAP